MSSRAHNNLGDALDGRTILVTGAAGFVGSAVVARLARVPCRIRRLLRQPRASAQAPGVVAEITDFTGDIQQPSTWLAALEGVDMVIHLAGQTSVYTAEQDPAADLTANVLPVVHLAAACRALGRRPVVVFAGTATEVGLTTTVDPVNESAPDRPVTIYDIHKLLAERYLEKWTLDDDLRGVTLRLANVYGPGPISSSAERGFMTSMIRRALQGQPLTLYGEGECVRDYVYVDDVVDAILGAGVQPGRTAGQHFIVGSGHGTTIREALDTVTDRVALRTGVRVPVVSVTPPATLSPIEGRHFVADTRRLRDATGWVAQTGLIEGIDRTIAGLVT